MWDPLILLLLKIFHMKSLHNLPSKKCQNCFLPVDSGHNRGRPCLCPTRSLAVPYILLLPHIAKYCPAVIACKNIALIWDRYTVYRLKNKLLILCVWCYFKADMPVIEKCIDWRNLWQKVSHVTPNTKCKLSWWSFNFA